MSEDMGEIKSERDCLIKEFINNHFFIINNHFFMEI